MLSGGKTIPYFPSAETASAVNILRVKRDFMLITVLAQM